MKKQLLYWIFAAILASAPVSAQTVSTNAGTVTSVICGTGLTGGTITSSGTCAVSYGSSAGTAAQGNDSRFTVHTQQILTSGTGATYTTPAGVRQLVVTEIGGGGAGSGGGTTGPNNGTAGAASSFNGITAAGGAPGTTAPAAGGTGGSGTARRTPGAPGGLPALQYGSATAVYEIGGNGSGQGGGVGVAAGAGNGGAANSGGGGAGGGSSNIAISSGSTLYHGYGGSQAETAQFIINSPAGTYSYTVGGGGTGGGAGTGGFAGGGGASGIIIVDEYY